MKERPILFSAPMVRALLAGQKMQTRRVNKVACEEPAEAWRTDGHGTWYAVSRLATSAGIGVPVSDFVPCPYGQPGDRLWVRETWAPCEADGTPFVYRADQDDDGSVPYLVSGAGGFGGGVGSYRPDRWRPSIHMPRAASRITLEIKMVRVERLQDISEADAQAEGVGLFIPDHTTPAAAMALCNAGRPCAAAFCVLWHAINGATSWDQNPWLWCLSFERAQLAGKGA